MHNLKNIKKNFHQLLYLFYNEDKNLSEDIIKYTKKYQTELGIESVIKIGQKRG